MELIGNRAERFGLPGAQAGGMPPPRDYALDAYDLDVLLLLRADGTTAAAFSVRGVTKAAEKDAHAPSDGRLP